MKIYRKAQVSSIMYHGDDEVTTLPSGITYVTPSPDIAHNNGDHVSAFMLSKGKYFEPESMFYQPSKKQMKKLNELGYLGYISGDFLCVFDSRTLKPIGEYNFQEHMVQ